MMPLDPFYVFLFFWQRVLEQKETGFLHQPINKIEGYTPDIDTLYHIIANPTLKELVRRNLKNFKFVKSMEISKLISP